MMPYTNTRTFLDENNTGESIVSVPQVDRGDSSLEVPTKKRGKSGQFR